MPGARLTVRESEVAAERDEGVEREKESLEWGSCPSSTVKGPFLEHSTSPSGGQWEGFGPGEVVSLVLHADPWDRLYGCE